MAPPSWTHGEPLLILQKMSDEIFGIALTSHAAHFQDDKMLWLKEHMAAINWSSREDLKKEVAAYPPEAKRGR